MIIMPPTDRLRRKRLKILSHQKGKCSWCGKLLKKDATLSHKFAVIFGGTYCTII